MTLREQLHARCRGYCEKCGWPLGTNWAMHHRVLQSRRDVITNVMALHHECHNLGKDAVHLNVEQAMDDGYIVSQAYDPAEIPLLLRGHTWTLLTPEGTYRYLTEERDHAAP